MIEIGITTFFGYVFNVFGIFIFLAFIIIDENIKLKTEGFSFFFYLLIPYGYLIILLREFFDKEKK